MGAPFVIKERARRYKVSTLSTEYLIPNLSTTYLPTNLNLRVWVAVACDAKIFNTASSIPCSGVVTNYLCCTLPVFLLSGHRKDSFGHQGSHLQ